MDAPATQSSASLALVRELEHEVEGALELFDEAAKLAANGHQAIARVVRTCGTRRLHRVTDRALSLTTVQPEQVANLYRSIRHGRAIDRSLRK